MCPTHMAFPIAIQRSKGELKRVLASLRPLQDVILLPCGLAVNETGGGGVQKEQLGCVGCSLANEAVPGNTDKDNAVVL